jgi:hypothetical protein
VFQSDDSLLLRSSPRPTSPARERRTGMRRGPTTSRRMEEGSVWWQWDCGGDKIHVKARGAQSSDNGEARVELVSYSSTALAIASLTSVPTACRHRRDGDPAGKEAEQPPLADRVPPAVPSRGRGVGEEGECAHRAVGRRCGAGRRECRATLRCAPLPHRSVPLLRAGEWRECWGRARALPRAMLPSERARAPPRASAAGRASSSSAVAERCRRGMAAGSRREGR